MYCKLVHTQETDFFLWPAIVDYSQPVISGCIRTVCSSLRSLLLRIVHRVLARKLGCWYYRASRALKLCVRGWNHNKSILSDNEIELRHHMLCFCIIVRKDISEVIRQRGPPTPLRHGIPARRGTIFQLLTNGQRRKHLLIAHDVFLVGALQSCRPLPFPFLRRQCHTWWGTADVLGYMDVSIRFVGVFTSRLVWYSGVWWITWQLKSDSMRFSRLVVDAAVEWYSFINGATGKPPLMDSFLTETVERSTFSCSRTIECALYGHYTPPHRVILHVVGEYHKLSNVDEATELSVWETFQGFIRLLSATIPPWLFGFFTSMKQRRQAIDK